MKTASECGDGRPATQTAAFSRSMKHRIFEWILLSWPVSVVVDAAIRIRAAQLRALGIQ